MAAVKISPEDWVEIANLLGRYQWLLDGGDAEAWSRLFTRDGAVLGVGEDIRGPEALSRSASMTHQGFGGLMRHATGAMWIEYGQNRDEAVARYYALVTTWLEGPGPELFNMGLCEAHLLRIEGEWKIKSNTIQSLRGGAASRAMAGADAARTGA